MAATADAKKSPALCCRRRTTRQRPFSLKQQRCPHCGCTETLNRHSKLYGNDPAQSNGQALRGQRVFCSNRGQRGGCGRTFSLFVAQVLPRHSVTTLWLWPLLSRLLGGWSIKASVEALAPPFKLETLYHLLQRLRARLPDLRCRLWPEQQAPPSSRSDPLLQTIEHLQSVFAEAACALSAFQLRFQEPFLG